MEQMNVQEMTDRLKVRYKRISEPTKVLWDKSIRYIKDIDVRDVDDDVAADYLEYAENNLERKHSQMPHRNPQRTVE